MDKEGIVFGILLSLLAQGFYDIIFYVSQGKYVEEWAALTATSGTLLFLLLVLSRKGFFSKDKRKSKTK
jgi:hypothetical protein